MLRRAIPVHDGLEVKRQAFFRSFFLAFDLNVMGAISGYGIFCKITCMPQLANSSSLCRRNASYMHVGATGRYRAV